MRVDVERLCLAVKRVSLKRVVSLEETQGLHIIERILWSMF